MPPTPEPAKPAEAEPAKTPEPAKPAEPPAPIKYEFKLPDGVELQPEGLEEASKLFNEIGIPADKAQGLMDLYIKNVQAAIAASGEASKAEFIATRKAWTDEVMADAEIGGANFPQVKATVGRLIDNYGAPGLREALMLTGADNNPAVIRSLFRMGKALTEGGSIVGKPAGEAAPRSLADRMYPDGGKTTIRGQ